MSSTTPGFPVVLDLVDATAVVVGGDPEGARRTADLLACGAAVRLVAAEPGAGVAQWVTATGVTLHPPPFEATILDGARLVLVTDPDPVLREAVRAAARARGVLCWCHDDPPRSELSMPAVARLGPARLAISTGGRAPALAARLRAELEAQLGATFGRFVEALGEERARIRAEEPDPARRRDRTTRLLEGLALTVSLRYPAWFTRKNG